MKDEIKEILYKLNYGDYKYRINGRPYKEIEAWEIDLLLDYITTAQYKLEKAQSKIDKAIEYIKRCRDYHKTYHNEDKMFPDELTSLIIILQGGDE